MTKEVTIFSSLPSDYDMEETRKYLAEEVLDVPVEEVSDEEVREKICSEIDLFYEDEKANLNKTLEGRILAIARVGRWNGTFSGYKILGDNLNEVLYFGGCDDIKVIADKNAARSTLYHHDGHHDVEFRMIKEDKNIDVLLDKIYANKFTRQDVYRYTKSLRPYIKEVYGV